MAFVVYLCTKPIWMSKTKTKTKTAAATPTAIAAAHFVSEFIRLRFKRFSLNFEPTITNQLDS